MGILDTIGGDFGNLAAGLQTGLAGQQQPGVGWFNAAGQVAGGAARGLYDTLMAPADVMEGRASLNDPAVQDHVIGLGSMLAAPGLGETDPAALATGGGLKLSPKALDVSRRYAGDGSAQGPLTALLDQGGMGVDEFHSRLFGGVPTANETAIYGPFGVSITADLLGQDGRTIGDMQRTFANNRVEHSLFQLSPKAQGQGVSQSILSSQIPLYQDLGLDGVDVHAAAQNGGYTWGRYGFTPDENSWDVLRSVGGHFDQRLNRLDRQMSDATHDAMWAAVGSEDPHALYAIANARNPAKLAHNGPALPIGMQVLKGSNWEGALNFNDPAAMQQFSRYTNGELRTGSPDMQGQIAAGMLGKQQDPGFWTRFIAAGGA